MISAAHAWPRVPDPPGCAVMFINLTAIRRLLPERASYLHHVTTSRSLPLDPVEAKALLLFCALVVCGTYAVAKGIDTNFDLKNYHLYVPYELLHFRYDYDIAPAQIQTYLNPTIDLPFFFLFKLFNSEPRLVAFVMGAVHGLNVYVLATLAWLTFVGHSTLTRVLLTSSAVTIGVTGAGFPPLIGTTTGDLFVSILVLSGVYIVVAQMNSLDLRARLTRVLLGASLVGFAAGIKLVAGVYVIALLIAGVICTPNAREKLAIALGSLTGSLLGGGWYFVLMEFLFQNPVFPYFNRVFKSPYFEPISSLDARFFPKTTVDWALYPFRWGFANHPVVSELALRDPRAAITLTLLTIAAAGWLITYWRHPKPTDGFFVKKPLSFLSIFWISSYSIWLVTFAIYRYFIPLELLSGVLIVALMCSLFQSPAKSVAFSILTATIVLYLTERPDWGHAQFANKYIDVTAPYVDPGSLVVVVGDEPVSFVIPFFDSAVRFVSINNNLLKSNQNNLLVERARTLISEQQGPLFSLEEGEGGTEESKKAYGQIGLIRGEGTCITIRNNLQTAPLLLCPLKHDDH
jgi:hypothetical protein